MQTMENIKMQMSMLKHHPDNPRKELGDLDELTKSIKKNGILQNLSIIPIDSDGDDCAIEDAAEYYVLIGNRRFEASKKAGLKEVRCNIIEGLTKKEQLAIMLEENMQRSDLTPIEEAEGFQMMLDLGETIEGLEKKTGFSSATIHHRVNIAKLDKKELSKKQKEFQISLTDLYALEKVTSVKKRNEIIKDAYSSNDIRVKAERAAREEAIERNAKAFKETMSDLGIKKNNGNVFAYWDMTDDIEDTESEWLEVAEVDLSEDWTLPEFKVTDDMIYAHRYCEKYIIARPHPNYGKGEKGETEEERKRREAQEAEKRHIEALKDFERTFKQNYNIFAEAYISGEVKKPIKLRGAELTQYLWDKILKIGISVKTNSISHYYYNMENEKQIDWWRWIEGKDKKYELYQKKAESLLIDEQMIMSIGAGLNWINSIDYSGKYRNAECAQMREYVELLERFEVEIPDYIKQVFDGTHEYYK